MLHEARSLGGRGGLPGESQTAEQGRDSQRGTRRRLVHGDSPSGRGRDCIALGPEGELWLEECPALLSRLSHRRPILPSCGATASSRTMRVLVLLAGSGILVVATLVLAIVVRLGLALMRRRPRGYWRRTLWVHVALFVVHLFATMPLLLGWFGSRWRRRRAATSGPTPARGSTTTVDGFCRRVIRCGRSARVRLSRPSCGHASSAARCASPPTTA